MRHAKVYSFCQIYRFYDIAWSLPNDDHPRGIIAGALENGSLDLWDAEKLIAGASDAFMSRTTKHSGAIKSLQFNPIQPHVLATAGAKGELFIFDVEDLASAIRLGTPAARSDDIECVAWNRKLAHIVATGGAGGFITVWDLKSKKATFTLNNNRKPVSAIAWDPTHSTKLLTATPDDTAPLILLWDLRNSNAPERALQGHEQGVLSLSWCQQDPDLLLSCGKDNRTMIWNPQTGERYGEFPEVTNWTFLTRFNPHNPNLSATASFDGKITIQTLQNTNASAAQAAAQNSLDGEDFFTRAQTQPQGASFSLAKAPAWYERPVGVSFGYGGKLVMFRKNQTATGQRSSSRIQIAQFSADSDIGTATEQFEAALGAGDIASICKSHIEQAKSKEDEEAWKVLQSLNDSDGRTNIVQHLGFGKEETDPEAEEESRDKVPPPAEQKAGGLSAPAKANGHKKRISSLWADGDGGDDFLSELTANKGAKTGDPFHLLSGENTALEDRITKALMVGDFEKAAEICLEEDRMADAFVIGNCGGKDLLEKVQAAYLTKKKGSLSYLRLLSSVVVKNLWDVVYNADLANWKETMVTLCTFADPSEFPDLCEGLGDRILETGSRNDACFCYIVGSKLDKVVEIWIEELEEAERDGLQGSGSDSTFSVHARSLQHFIEKVAVFRHVTKFSDSEKDLTSGWKLASLYDKYTEYADIVAAHGQLAIAQKYLNLLPAKYPAAEVARNRIRLATQKAAPQGRQQAAAGRVPSRQQPSRQQQQYPSSSPNPMNAYPAPPTQPPAAAAYNQYAPQGNAPFQPPGASTYAPPGAGYTPSPPPVGAYGPPLGYNQPTPFGAPPRANQQQQTPAPPQYKAKPVSDWNDTPMVIKPPTRKQTPRVAPITSPFPNQPNLSSPPPAGAFPGQRGTATPPPPPPKGSGPPPMGPPPTSGPPPQAGQQISRPSSTTNAYTPPPPQPGLAAMPQVVPRTASPYNAPPAGPPPTSRYAPAPAAQQQFNQPPSAAPTGPPPGNRPPPPNPYAPAQQAAQSPSPYAPNQFDAAPQGGRPPVGPPPSGGPPPAAAKATPTPPPPRAAAPPKAKYPPGDRSHIPPSAQRLVEILDRDMQRVAAMAPASFSPQVKDAQKRIGLLFDHLNNSELVKEDTIGQLSQLAEALESKDFDTAHRLQVEIQRNKTDECGNWMVRPTPPPSLFLTT